MQRKNNHHTQASYADYHYTAQYGVCVYACFALVKFFSHYFSLIHKHTFTHGVPSPLSLFPMGVIANRHTACIQLYLGVCVYRKLNEKERENRKKNMSAKIHIYSAHIANERFAKKKFIFGMEILINNSKQMAKHFNLCEHYHISSLNRHHQMIAWQEWNYKAKIRQPKTYTQRLRRHTIFFLHCNCKLCDCVCVCICVCNLCYCCCFLS